MCKRVGSKVKPNEKKCIDVLFRSIYNNMYINQLNKVYFFQNFKISKFQSVKLLTKKNQNGQFTKKKTNVYKK